MNWDVDNPDTAPEAFPNRISEVAAWRLLSEMVRRHPTRFWIRSAFPIEGLPYDCLALCELDSLFARVMVNRTGSGAAIRAGLDAETETVVRWTSAWKDTGEAESWLSLPAHASGDGPLALDSPMLEWIRLREQEMGLEPPRGGLPGGTPSTLAVRWIAQFLCMQFGSRRAWYSYCGKDWPAEDLGLHKGHQEWIRAHDREDMGRLWYLVEGGHSLPPFCLSAEGDLWTSARHVRLQDEHQSGSSITDLVVRTAGDVFP